MLPFSREQLIAIFIDYNAAVWPTQVFVYVLGLGMVVMLVRPSEAGSRFISAGSAVMWIWIGVAYHWLYFSAINHAAWAFGALFVLQRVRVPLCRGHRRWPRIRPPAWNDLPARLGHGGLCGRCVSAGGHVERAPLPRAADVRDHAVSGDDLHLRADAACSFARAAVVARDSRHLVAHRGGVRPSCSACRRTGCSWSAARPRWPSSCAIGPASGHP